MEHKIIKRATAKIRRVGKCYVWRGATNGHGYGVMRRGGRRYMAASVFADMFGVTRRSKSDCEDRACISCGVGFIELAAQFGFSIQNRNVLRKFAIFYQNVLKRRKFDAEYQKCISFYGEKWTDEKISRPSFREGCIKKVHLAFAALTPRKIYEKKSKTASSFASCDFGAKSALDIGECTSDEDNRGGATSVANASVERGLDRFEKKREKGKGGKGVRDSESFYQERRLSASDSRIKKMGNLKQPKIKTVARDSALDCFRDTFDKAALKELAELLAKSKGRKRTKYQYAMPHDWRPTNRQVDWFCCKRKKEVEAEILTGESDITNLGGYITWLAKEVRKERDAALKVWRRLAYEESKRLGSVSPNIRRDLKVMHDGERKTVSEAIYQECSKLKDLGAFAAEMAAAHGVRIKAAKMASEIKSNLPPKLKDFPRLFIREARSRIRQQIEAMFYSVPSQH